MKVATARALAFAAVASCTSIGCSLILDFPEEGGVLGGGAAGGEPQGGGPQGGGPQGGGPQGGGPQGGAPPEGGACSGGVVVEDVTWLGEVRTPTEFDYVNTTGLVRNGDSVLAYGEASGDPDGLSFPTSPSNLLYIIELDRSGDSSVYGSVVPCDEAVPGYSVAGRASRTMNRLFISGALSSDDNAAYGLSKGGDDSCEETGGNGIFTQAGGLYVPFFALADATAFDGGTAELSPGAEGVTLDTAAGGGVTAGVGVSFGDVFPGDTADGEPTYFIARSPEGAGGTEVARLSQLANNQDYPRDMPAGVAVDDDGVVWATGTGCDDAFDCNDEGELFVDTWGRGAPEGLDISASGQSFGSVIRSADDRIFLGGGYRGDLEIAGTVFERAGDVDAFVAAIDVAGRSVLWTYPSATNSLAHDSSGYDAVADLAVVEDDACGSVVYVVGCITDAAALASCTPRRPDELGRYAFVTKLDGRTGAVIDSFELLPNDPSTQLLLPTAVAADEDGLWVAMSFHGQYAPEGLSQVEVDQGAATMLLRFRP